MNEHNPALAYTDEESNRQLRVLAAPGMLDQNYVVVREPDETDVEYDARVRLFNLLLDQAKHG